MHACMHACMYVYYTHMYVCLHMHLCICIVCMYMRVYIVLDWGAAAGYGIRHATLEEWMPFINPAASHGIFPAQLLNQLWNLAVSAEKTSRKLQCNMKYDWIQQSRTHIWLAYIIYIHISYTCHWYGNVLNKFAKLKKSQALLDWL